MKPLILLTILAFGSLFSYSQENNLYLDPESATGTKAANLFSEINIIPLQNTKQSDFNNMADFLITPDRLIFTDNEANAILIFDKQGKFLHKFKKKKYRLGGLQYIAAKNAVFFTSSNKNFTIPLFKSQQILKKPGTRDFSRYVNLELLYLDEKENYRIEKLPVPKYAIRNLYYVNGKYVFANTRYNKFVKDTVQYHMNFVDGDEITKSYFPYLNIGKLPTEYEDVGFNINRTLNDSVFYVQKNYDNTIYKLVNDSLQPAYKFVFPAAQTMPNEFHSTAFKNNIDFTSYKNKYGKAIRSFYNMIDLKDFLFFRMTDNAWGSKPSVFNKVTSRLYDLSKITTDSSVYFLPAKIFSRLNNYDEQYIYTFISSDDLLKEKTNILGRYKEGVPEPVKKMFEGLSKFNNAIIIQLKLKPGTTVK